MSFMCGFCKTTAPNGTKARMVPTEVRVTRDSNSEVLRRDIAKEQPCCESCWSAGVTAEVVEKHRVVISSRTHEDDLTDYIMENERGLTFGRFRVR
jgi:hypothetical protein